ncbi:glycoside hydrolase family 15 protein [Belnapia moabensis]|uniref:glycoside hydrolase family 15 protein n=1 Tax=Belnapia moabensis TaxID=365533 RepID=UPI0024800213|nr:glycoside hydrolase family 15 protein [Belnapia moabensis]
MPPSSHPSSFRARRKPYRSGNPGRRSGLQRRMSKPIEDYALIGDGETAALVARDGSIDWLCWPRFDDDACFAALLGGPDHGRWRLAPRDPALRVTRRYQGDTLVLETEFETATGAIRLTDFMPAKPEGGTALVRMLTGLRGEVEMECDLRLRFDYGSVPCWLTPRPDGMHAVVGPDQVILHSPAPLETAEGTTHGRFTLAAGETIPFVLRYARSYDPEPGPIDAGAALDRTLAYWQGWIGQFDKPTEWPEAVRRSLLTLKALSHPRTGGLIAAPTLGLPEKPGGGMNWDYRYCWVRDSTFTCCALLNAGFREEARDWLQWLLRAIGGTPEKMRIMYRVDGSRCLEEWQAPWLPGYEGSRPVRIGNAAASQVQLDVFGEILDTVHLARRSGIDGSEHGRRVGRTLIEFVERIWRQPDQGLWESRGEPQHHVYSKAMCWVAVDRFLKVHADDGLEPEALTRLAALRDEIHAEVCRRGYDPRLDHFVQYYGAQALDASLLMLPLMGFLPIEDPRIAGTIAAIERHLLDGGIVHRYADRADDQEGAFIACSCWLADCMAMQGRHEEARALFLRVLDLRNDVGLLAEEYHLPSRRLIGNFPQALSHIALINTGLGLCGPVMRRTGGSAS